MGKPDDHELSSIVSVAAQLAGQVRESSATVQRSDFQRMNPMTKLEILTEQKNVSLGS